MLTEVSDTVMSYDFSRAEGWNLSTLALPLRSSLGVQLVNC